MSYAAAGNVETEMPAAVFTGKEHVLAAWYEAYK
jgi:hypothetical protein